MIKSINGAQGIKVIREGDKVRFIGHFKEGITSEMVITVADARSIIESTGTNEIYKNGVCVGLIGNEPQGTTFFFPPNQNYDLIVVSSLGLKRVVKRLTG